MKDQQEDNETQRPTDTCETRCMSVREIPLPLQLALWQQRTQSTERHKDALEGLVRDHHRHIEQLTEQLHYDRECYGERIEQQRKEIEVLRYKLVEKADLIKSWADQRYWIGNLYTHPRPEEAMPFRELLLLIASGMLEAIPNTKL